MGRIVEVLIGINALGGIVAFLGFKHAGRKARDKVIHVFGKNDPPQPNDVEKGET